MAHNTFKSKIEAFYRVEFPVFYPRIYPHLGVKYMDLHEMESSLKQRIYKNILRFMENYRYIKSTAEATIPNFIFLSLLWRNCRYAPY